ncbi:TatD family hydrolase [Endozoicomonas gorgoniicola]|uniref:TatD family hydrolase n=1 Tax=Endozoicomonas gorgoniicola TaxID=1234144 RepID=A0ABT3MX03_9GAMM|nr:TatD family hydrolase [Endozoicomonas gorgoniicola]MCW7553909.1 TatD family hydrolase [Endozoicomonas gorgoniicola]
MITCSPLIDSHCHLDFPEFDPDRSQVLTTAFEQGVEVICVPGTESERWEPLLQMCSDIQKPVKLFAALGIHPWFVGQHEPNDLQRLAEYFETNEHIVAVGEAGLDFALQSVNRKAQMFWLTEQLELARQFGKPVILHARKAHDLILKQLRQKPVKQGGIVHAFSGSEQQAYQYIEQGFCLGFGGGITYPRAKKTRALAASLPLSSLVLETDAPDMPLCGFQGQRNEPAQLTVVLETLAELRREPKAEIAEATRLNTIKILSLLP